MIIAQWRIEAKFGHKPKVIELLNKWNDQFGTQVGWTDENSRQYTGSVGASESVIVQEVRLESLAALNESFDKLATLDGHAEWGREMEPHVVSGTNRWEIYREL